MYTRTTNLVQSLGFKLFFEYITNPSRAKSHLRPTFRPGLAQPLASGQSRHITIQYLEHTLIAIIISIVRVLTSWVIYFLFLCNGGPSLRSFLSFCDSSADISNARSLWGCVLHGEEGRGWIRHHAGIFKNAQCKCYSPCSEDSTHWHSTAPGPDSRWYPGIMRGISHKIKHHLQHESATLPDPALCLHSFEPLRWEPVTRVSHILVNNNGRTVPVVHQEPSGWRDTNIECQSEFFGVLKVSLDKSLTNHEIGNAQASPMKYPPSCV